MSFRYLPFLILPLLLLSTFAGLRAQSEIDLGTITAEGREKPRPVEIVAPGELGGLLRTAFSAHGAFQPVEEGGLFTLRFRPVEGGAVEVAISSGRPRVEQFRRSVSAGSLREAALRAADVAVEKITGVPGIFASTLVFVSDRTGHAELYTSDLFFQNFVQRTNDRSESVGPHFSPDGGSVLYTGYYRNDLPDLYLLDLKSGRRTVFLSFKGINTGGAFSPDGRRVACVLSGTGNAELYLTDRSGRDVRRLTRTESLEADPSWSPDGQRIVYTSDARGRPQLYVMSASGGPTRRLPTDISRYCAEPAWNPRDAEQIVFTLAQGGSFQLGLFRFSGEGSTVLTSGAGDAVEPVWLRDGRHVVYTQRTMRSRRLMLLDTVTGSIAPLHAARFGNAWQADVVY